LQGADRPSHAGSLAGVDPLEHFQTSGWREGRDPNQFFDTKFYLNQNPDVAAAGVNPLQHYETYGWKEGRDPSYFFDTRKYLQGGSGATVVGEKEGGQRLRPMPRHEVVDTGLRSTIDQAGEQVSEVDLRIDVLQAI
jgi:hypothetical protein